MADERPSIGGIVQTVCWLWFPPLMYCLLLIKLLMLISQLSAWALLPVALLAAVPLLLSVGRTVLR